MSDASQPARKVSREGIVLIKSFEGFRPRAVPRAEGGWMIGYGHTLSAREGATVSEGDAELLLRYDLLPIEKSVNVAAPAMLNQHQFDALVSFGFSVGLERFEASDVLTRLSSGATTEAAEAMMAWPATEIPTAGLRRRAAERALFGADPSRPISLADLLSAPVPEAVSEPAPTNIAPSPVPTPEVPATATAATMDAVPQDAADSRSAAVAALLGEPETSAVEPAPIVPSFATPVARFDPSTVAPDRDGLDRVDESRVAVAANDAEASGEALAADPIVEDTPDPASVAASPTQIQTTPVFQTPSADLPADAASGGDTSALSIQRYAPYGTPIVGPLPFLQPLAAPMQPEQSAEGPAVAFDSQTGTESLVLTSPEDAPPAVLARPAWTADEREEAAAVAQPETGLFGDDLSLTQGGQPLGRPDFEPEAPVSFDWSETGAFIIMGAVGLTAFGASMAAFRLASEQGGGDETSIIGWVLAVIGVACVGVSSLNLYRRFGLPGGDR